MTFVRVRNAALLLSAASLVFIAALFIFGHTPASADKVTTTYQSGSNTVTKTTDTFEGYNDRGDWCKQVVIEEVFKDKAGNIVKKTYNRTLTYYDKKGGKPTSFSSESNTDTYNEAGGYERDRSVDYKDYENGETSHSKTKAQFDARDHLISGERTTTEKKSDGTNKTTKEQFDREKHDWVEVGMSPGGPAASEKIAVLPRAGDDGGYGDIANVSAPPFAGPRGEIVLNVQPNPNAPTEGGAQGVLVVTETASGKRRYFRITPDRVGRLVFLAEPAMKFIRLVSRMLGKDKPDEFSTCQIGNPSHVPGTNALANVPARGPVIKETVSSAQPGELVRAHISGDNPARTRFWLDNTQVKPLGISDNSAVVRIPTDSTLAHHRLVMESDGKRSNAVTVAVVHLTPHPLAPSEPGVVQTVTVDVSGLTPADQAQMQFECSGAATMATGGATATVPVVGGVAKVQIKGIHAGQALLRFHLQVKNPQFVT